MKFLQLCYVIFSVILFAIQTAMAQSEIVYATFDNRHADDWLPLDPAFWEVRLQSVADYVYCIKGTPRYYSPDGKRLGQYSRLSGHSVADFNLQCYIKLGTTDSANNGVSAGLVFGFKDSRNYYYALLNRNPDFIGILRVQNGSVTTLDTLQYPLHRPPEHWYEIKLSRRGSIVTLQVEEDTTRTLSVIDQTFAVGQLGLGSIDDAPCFDDILIVYERTNKPRPDFVADATSGRIPFTVSFRDASEPSVPGGPQIISYDWDFDEDNKIDSHEKNPTHVFTKLRH